jgi:hypothetical protein
LLANQIGGYCSSRFVAEFRKRGVTNVEEMQFIRKRRADAIREEKKIALEP